MFLMVKKQEMINEKREKKEKDNIIKRGFKVVI